MGTGGNGERMLTALFVRIQLALSRDDEGQGLAEYALILALIAIVAIVALLFLGKQVSTVLEQGRLVGLTSPARVIRLTDPTPSGVGSSIHRGNTGHS